MLKSRFDLGQIVATQPALQALQDNNQSALGFVKRHSECDWGSDLCSEDKELNDEALIDGSRLLSSYLLKDGKTKLWIITEAADENGKRIATTVLLPSDY